MEVGRDVKEGMEGDQEDAGIATSVVPLLAGQAD